MYHSPTVPSYLPIALVMHSSFSTKTLPSIKSYTANQAFCQLFPSFNPKNTVIMILFTTLNCAQWNAPPWRSISLVHMTHPTQNFYLPTALFTLFFKITPLRVDLFFWSKHLLWFSKTSCCWGNRASSLIHWLLEESTIGIASNKYRAKFNADEVRRAQCNYQPDLKLFEKRVKIGNSLPRLSY